jgi:glucosyl-3-phosphoglycerate synthase
MFFLDNLKKWIDSNTYNSLDYSNLEHIYLYKKNKTISLVIPTLNEESTIEYIVDKIFNELNNKFQLLDEVIIIDGGSTDNTLKIVNNLKNKYDLLKLVNESDILVDYKSKKGKGNQLWKGLYCSKGDIVLYCDSDIKNFDIRMIYGLIGPLLLNNIKFIKGFYERPLIINNQIQNNEGGRVTELCARPLLNIYYPELSGFIQPLGGEYGGYREVLENVEYMTGYGVEVSILIEIYEKYGIHIMGQVDLLRREHRHQNVNALSKMSFNIMNTILKKNNLKNLNNSILIKNYKKNNDIFVKNNITNEETINQYFMLINDANDEILPPLNKIKIKNNNNNNELY